MTAFDQTRLSENELFPTATDSGRTPMLLPIRGKSGKYSRMDIVKYHIAIGLWMLTGSAQAGPLNGLTTCYIRDYDESHLASQTEQNVRSLSLQIFAQDERVILSGIDLDGRFGYLTYSCTEATDCGTWEKDSQIWIGQKAGGDIVIKTRNALLSDIGGFWEHVEDSTGHYAFYLEDDDGYHSYSIGSGPFYHFRLSPATADACPIIPSRGH